MKHGHGRHSVHHGPNMTPMVDIVMCILIFFMLAMTFAIPDLYLTNNMPAIDKGGISGEAAEGKAPEVQNKIELRRVGDRTKAYCFNQMVEELGDNKDSSTLTLPQLLAQKRAEMSKDVQLIIVPEKWVSYQDVITVYDVCMKAHFENVAFAAPR